MSYSAHDEHSGLEIAIVGMVGRFPSAADIDAFWRNLAGGVESITTFRDEELLAAGVAPELLRDPSYVRAGAVLEGIDLFDASFFDLTPREAELMDPQHRLFLECAWEALEHAGYAPERTDAAIGVYAGANLNTYALGLFTTLDPTESMGNLSVLTGNEKDYLTTRVSHKLDLRGPSVAVQTACSTSLVAVHMACRALLGGECDLALAGGVSVRVPAISGYLYQRDGIYSPDGHCRAFDAQAQGTTFGSGVGVVVLKRLADALDDGDTIHAVIKGSAINNDGAAKVGYTAPGVDGQVRVIADALAVAGVDARAIGYVEAHGTATPLGDPIEIAALTEAFGAQTEERGFCAIGSVKTNIGHLDTAAGIAGLIKTVMALRHGQLPPSLHFQTPNPQIDFAQTPFYVNTALAPWPASSAPRRAGVSSFGIGGTNAHLILEEAPAPPPPAPARPSELLVLSARSPAALARAAERLAQHLLAHPELPLADVASTLQTGRRAFAHRLALVCHTTAEAVAILGDPASPRRMLSTVEPQRRPVAWLFPGQGAQHTGMGAGLYAQEPAFRDALDRCAALLKPHLGLDIRTLIFAEPETESTKDTKGPNGSGQDNSQLKAQNSKLTETQFAQPALFAVEYALAQLWLARGLQPQALLGHSLGEYVAATVAGVFSLEDALALVAARGKLMQTLGGGAMLAVALGEQQLLELLPPELALAAVNAPELCVVAGPRERVAAFQARLEQQQISCRPLHVSQAFHSPLVEPILGAFRQQLQRVSRRAPQLPIASNLTGGWLTAAEATSVDYWVRQARQPVRFAEGLRTLEAGGASVLLEVGPGHSLSALARQQRSAGTVVQPSLPHPQEAAAAKGEGLWPALAGLWLAGVELDWSAGQAGCRRVPLPTYPFERQRFWVEAQPKQAAAPAHTTLLSPRSTATGWLHLPSWRRSAPPPSPNTELVDQTAGPWMIWADGCGVSDELSQRLVQSQQTVIWVVPGEQFRDLGEGRFAIDPRRREDYSALVQAVRKRGPLPTQIIHLWTLTAEAFPDAAETTDRGFFSLLFLAQALGEQRDRSPLAITVVSNGLQRVACEPQICPEKALVLGPCTVIPLEYPQIRCRSIDIELPRAGQRPLLAQRILAECLGAAGESPVAYRGRDRWVASLEPARPAPAAATAIRQGGTYLITGGLGGIGLELAHHLARTARATLILLGRSPLPARVQWPEILAGPSNRSQEIIRRLQAIEADGGRCVVVQADVADERALRTAVEQAEELAGPIHGVFHAAGDAGGGLIQQRSTEAARAVLAPKVQGTRALMAVFAGRPLDLLVLFSSTLALTGGIGQVDYCAANAYLNAVAAARSDDETLTIAICWDGWQEVGMAARAAGSAAQPTGHPLLGEQMRPVAGQDSFVARLAPMDHWVLNEHRIGGVATLPGTAYLEIVRAAFAHQTGMPIEVRGLSFFSPCSVADGASMELATRCERRGDEVAASVLSRPWPGEGGERPWREHARASLGPAVGERPPAIAIEALRARCPDTRALPDFAAQTGGLVAWGPRWHNVHEVALGQDECLALLELPEVWSGDLEQFALHPALLDVATSVLLLATGRTSYIPMAYRRVEVWEALPQRCYSHARLHGTATGTPDSIALDITLLDTDGRTLVAIEQLTLVHESILELRAAAPADKRTVEAQPGVMLPDHPDGDLPIAGALAALDRVLASLALPQIVVSQRELGYGATGVRPAAAPAAPAAPAHTYARPDLRTPFVAPQTEVEQQIAALWCQSLGVSEVGIHDEFFALGGHSLLAIHLIDQIRALFGCEIPLSALIETPTVAGLSALISQIQAERAAAEQQEILARLAELSDEEAEAELRKWMDSAT